MNGTIGKRNIPDNLLHELRIAANQQIKAQQAEKDAHKNLAAVVQKVSKHQHSKGDKSDSWLIGYICGNTELGIYPSKDDVFNTPVHMLLLDGEIAMAIGAGDGKSAKFT